MPNKLLTDMTLRKLEPTAEQVTCWDTRLPGFGIRARGRRVTSARWFFAYRANARKCTGPKTSAGKPPLFRLHRSRQAPAVAPVASRPSWPRHRLTRLISRPALKPHFLPHHPLRAAPSHLCTYPPNPAPHPPRNPQNPRSYHAELNEWAALPDRFSSGPLTESAGHLLARPG